MKDLKKLKQRRKEAAGLCLRRWKSRDGGKDEILDDDFDYDESEDLDNWLDEEDIGNDFMLRQQYINQNRADNLDHGFGGRDDDGFRGLDSEDGFDGPSASGFDFDDYDMDMEIE